MYVGMSQIAVERDDLDTATPCLLRSREKPQPTRCTASAMASSSWCETGAYPAVG
jgi:hypothetical protein